MFGIIREAVRRLIQEELAKSRGRAEAEARELVVEMNDALEKLAVWAARDAKRRAAEAKRGMESFDIPGPSPTVDRATLKARIRQGMQGLPIRARVTADPRLDAGPQAEEIARAQADIDALNRRTAEET